MALLRGEESRKVLGPWPGATAGSDPTQGLLRDLWEPQAGVILHLMRLDFLSVLAPWCAP